MLVVLPCHAKLDLQRLQTTHTLVLYNVKCFQTFDHFCLNVRFAIICDYDDSLQPCFKKNKSLQRSFGGRIHLRYSLLFFCGVERRRKIAPKSRWDVATDVLIARQKDSIAGFFVVQLNRSVVASGS